MDEKDLWDHRLRLYRDQKDSKQREASPEAKKRQTSNKRRKENRAIASERVLNENVIGCLKRFKILSDKYRNRRKRFGLHLNLIAGIYDNVSK